MVDGIREDDWEIDYLSALTRYDYQLLLCFLLFPPLEVLCIGKWAQLKGLEDDDLKRLASGLPATVLQTKATSTTKKYLGGFRRWKQWATEHKISILPADA